MARRKAKTKITKREIFQIILSIVLLFIIYKINRVNVIRLFLWLVVVFIIAKNVVKFTKKLKNHRMMTFILVLLLSVVLDGIITVTFKRISVFTYNVLTIDNVKVYTSPGLRVWQCDKNKYKNFIVQPFSEKGYLCNAENVATIESNSFLNSVVENYNEYRNTYVKVKGPISKKNGQNSIEMRPYEQSDVTVNGYVEFQDTITLRVIFDEIIPELDNYDVYDEIVVLGQIKNLEQENGKYIVYMAGAKIMSEVELDKYTIVVNVKDKCDERLESLVVTSTKDVYTYCLSEINVSYPDKKYELADTLSSNKLDIKELYNDARAKKKNEKDNTTLFIMGSYNVVVCDETKSRDVIIGSPNLSLEKATCTPKVEG